jgi:hypothetical protein
MIYADVLMCQWPLRLENLRDLKMLFNKKGMIKYLQTFIFLIFFTYGGHLNAATIRGRVIDSDTHEGIAGANIRLDNQKYGAISDIKGNYVIMNLPAGKYALNAECLGYKHFYSQEIILQTNQDEIVFDIYLKTDKISLTEVEVTGTGSKATDASARNSEKNADNIMNVVSARTIELSPDLTVANVVQRVSGVVIEKNSSGEGEYAIIRGMDKRFNYTLINSVKIPSPNPKYRYVPLNLFPASMVDRIEITKALTPSMEGDAVGGVVNMIMKDAPATWAVNISASGGYSQIFANRRFEGFNSDVINKKSPYEIYGYKYVATQSDFPADNLLIKNQTPLPNFVGDLSVGNRFFHKKLGVIIAASYINSYKGSNSTLLKFDVKTNDDSNLPQLTGMTSREISEQTKQAGIHNKIDYQFNDNHKLQLYNCIVDITNVQMRDSKGTDFLNDYAPEKGELVYSYSPRFRLNHQQLQSSILQGDHKLFSQLKVQWSLVHSLAKNEIPDNTSLSLVSFVKDSIESPKKVSATAGSRSWAHNTDEDWAYYFNLNYSPFIGNTPVEISTGGMYRDKKRNSYFIEYLLTPVGNPTDNTSTQGRDWNNYNDIKFGVIDPPDYTDPLNFDATEDIKAGYLQFKFLKKNFQPLIGVRVENTSQGYTLRYSKGQRAGVAPLGIQTYTDILPSLHFKYILRANQNFRASYFRSINRPGFLEIVPYIYNFEDYTEMGNPDIKHTVVDNLDLRYEYFPKALELIMVGVFYKRIKDPIEFASSPPQGSHSDVYYMPQNFGTARNYGAELDLIKYFGYFGIRGNYTWTNSQITTRKSLRIRDENGKLALTEVNQTRPLYGQAEHIANLSLLFKDPDHGWDAQLAAIYTGEKIYIVSQFLDNDQWQKGNVQMDASIDKKFKNGISLFVKIGNLINTPLVVYNKKAYSGNFDYPLQNQKETILRRDYYQQSYLIGIRYKF